MTEAPSYLAIDLGASSGRAVVGTLRDGVMEMREVHRFRTPLVEAEGHLWWDAEALWGEVRRGLALAREASPAVRSVSVDSWAVDYVPLGTDGEPLRRPYCYRDPRTRGRLDEAVKRAGGADALYERTGIQFLELNTLPQIVADLLDEPALVARTAKRLLIAEWLLYKLSGRMVAERTNASTTQLLDARTGRWAEDLIRAVGDDPARWPDVVPPGTALGEAIDAMGVLVIASCAHDTAAAVAAVPASPARQWAYVSSGTWSLVGAELDAPMLAPEARRAGFTNEAGLDGTVRFLKNRTGMWALEECLRAWEAEDGARPAYDALVAAAASSPSHVTLDLNAPAFGERGDMPARIAEACRAQGHDAPDTRGAVVRLILDSLAASYADTLAELDALTGRRTDDVHVVGGGARNALLNQLTADACGRRVLAGPEEATVLGNLLVQARTMGDLAPGSTVRDAARRSARLTEYTPRSSPALR
ncbi:Carbohydrate kinase, FGGY [Gemmatirosa kalamazoonensis]|uniref:Carbohydrate kinase, FGGY n=1 Tax=Gemmatirosa kalamazoonensis TaxID=861299 RepID=W0RG29_9BACT|nr:rhamnulokinase family protein [Gemmatirosa kalamazoonensis]AHG89392.1 Carbohydrate kinase, FGGY [Gemmatirosa kalamazoonensis]